MKPFKCMNPECRKEICLTNGYVISGGNMNQRPPQPVGLQCDTCKQWRLWVPVWWKAEQERKQLDIVRTLVLS